MLADNLVVTLDGEPLKFRWISRSYHAPHATILNRDYRFSTSWQPSVGRTHRLTIREGNDELDDFSRLHLQVTAADGVTLTNVTAPSEALLRGRDPKLKPGDAEKLRRLSAEFTRSLTEALGVYRRADHPILNPCRAPRTAYTVATTKPAAVGAC